MTPAKTFPLLILVLIAFQVSAQPYLQRARAHDTDILHIALDLRFDWTHRQAYGTSSITFTPFRPTDTLKLDAALMTIASVKTESGNELRFRYTNNDHNDNLLINLGKTYRPGDTLTVVVDYRTGWVNETDAGALGGSTGKGIRFFAPTANEPSKVRHLWSMGEPDLNRYVFPCYDAPNDLRTTDFKATVDAGLTAISNGSLVSVRSNADGTKTFHYKTTHPYPNYMTAFVVGEFKSVRQTAEGVEIYNYGYPAESDAVLASVERLPDMIRFFSEWTGKKFPFESYSQVFVNDLPWGYTGLGMTIESENMVDDYGTHKDYLYLWDMLEGESVAYQWFGAYVPVRDWSHIWLSKGFARYFSDMYNEYKNGRDEYLLWQHSFEKAAYFGDWSVGIRTPVVNEQYEDLIGFATGNYPYYRGAMVLHMLRKHLGDDTFRRAIQYFVAHNAGSPVATEDLRQAVEAASGQPMDWFFDQWVYRTGHPVFEVTKQFNEKEKKLALTVRQTQQADSLSIDKRPRYYKGYVDVEIDDRIERVWLSDREVNVFEFSSEQQPKLIQFDFEGTWIKEITFDRSAEELLYQYQFDKDVTGRMSALGELVALAKSDKTSEALRSRILAAMRSVVTGKSWWRLRLNSISQLQGILTSNATWSKPDKETVAMLQETIKNDPSNWVRSAAISFLGTTRQPGYVGIYLKGITDNSDRVVYTSAIALGRTKSARAFDALVKLINKPSWKNQSLIAALNGLKELGDPRGAEVAMKALADLKLDRWHLPTQLWDYRITAAETIAALGKADLAYPVIAERLKASMAENDINGVFNNILLITTLKDPRSSEAFELLRKKYAEQADLLTIVGQYEEQFRQAVK